MNVNHGMDLLEIANNLSNFVSNYSYDYNEQVNFFK